MGGGGGSFNYTAFTAGSRPDLMASLIPPTTLALVIRRREQAASSISISGLKPRPLPVAFTGSLQTPRCISHVAARNKQICWDIDNWIGGFGRMTIG